ncbi:MAG: WD40 repeat domain-containing protein, partial [Gemmataceae bacterium]|nr:WD40 repeat domain-containing protein [Gemmataceae bacterium]
MTAAAWHPSGKTCAFAVRQHLRVCDTQGRLAGPAATVAGRITAVQYDPQGRWLAVAHGEIGRQGIVSLLALTSEGRLASGQPAWVLEGHRDSVYALAFHPSGTLLASAGYDRDILLWEIPRSTPANAIAGRIKPVRLLKDHSDTVYGLAFHPRGSWLASAGADRAVKIWDTTSGKRLYTLSEATDWVYTVTWHPDGRRLAAGGVDRSIRVWEALPEGGRLIHSVFAHEGAVLRLVYSADGKLLISLGEDRVVKIWDAQKMTEVRALPAQPESVLALAVRPD